MRIVFLGAGEFGVPTLAGLHAAHDVALVISQPDRPAGRRRKLTPTPIGQWATDHDLPLVKTDQANAPDVLEQVDAADADAMVVVAFGQYLRPELVDLPRLGAMNLHASLLPRWRGASPINATLLNGDREAGNTAIRIARKMDAGAMLGQQAIPIDPMETAGELHDRLARLGPTLVLNVLSGLDAGTVAEIEQDHDAATLAPKLCRDDGWVDFAADAEAIRCRVHGLTPWPGVRATWAAEGQAREGEPIKLCRVEPMPDYPHDAPPGQLLTTAGLVAAGGGAVRLVEVQPPGKRVMAWADFAHGHPIAPGATFRSG